MSSRGNVFLQMFYSCFLLSDIKHVFLMFFILTSMFFTTMVCMSYRFWDIQRQRMAWPRNLGMGRSRSLKMAPFDRYDFLLVGHCKYSSMLYHFRVIWRWIIVTLKSVLEVTKIVQTGTIRKLGCGFLFAFHSNYGSILHYFRDKAISLSKIVIFFIPPCIRRPH